MDRTYYGLIGMQVDTVTIFFFLLQLIELYILTISHVTRSVVGVTRLRVFNFVFVLSFISVIIWYCNCMMSTITGISFANHCLFQVYLFKHVFRLMLDFEIFSEFYLEVYVQYVQWKLVPISPFGTFLGVTETLSLLDKIFVILTVNFLICLALDVSNLTELITVL